MTATITDPAIHLRFNDDLTDASGNDVTVSLAGTEAYESGQFGNGITFDGSTNLAFANDANFVVGTGDFTWAFWFKSSVANNDKFIIGGRGAWGRLHITTGGYYSNSAAGVIRYVASSTILGSTVLNDDLWHHIAIVRYSGTVTIYLDGVVDGSGTDTTNYTSSSGTWYISRNLYGGGQIRAAMDEFIFAAYAVYTAEFTPPDSAYNDSATQEILEDFTLDIAGLDVAAGYQTMEACILDISARAIITKDNMLDLFLACQDLAALPVSVWLARENAWDMGLDIILADGILTANVGMDISVGDGSKIESVGLDLMAVSTLPEFKSVYATNLTSAVREVTS